MLSDNARASFPGTRKLPAKPCHVSEMSKAVKKHRRRYIDRVDQGYHDFSWVPPPPAEKADASAIAENETSKSTAGKVDSAGENSSKAKAKEPTFPVKLHMILSNPEYEDIIAWLPHGRSWRIVQQKAFEEQVIPVFFRHGRYSSFARQVNGWGFQRIIQGSDYNSYYHELFLRGMPHLCPKMRRLTQKDILQRKNNASSDDDTCPNFYAISREFPLPDASTNKKKTLDVKGAAGSVSKNSQQQLKKPSPHRQQEEVVERVESMRDSRLDERMLSTSFNCHKEKEKKNGEGCGHFLERGEALGGASSFLPRRAGGCEESAESAARRLVVSAQATRGAGGSLLHAQQPGANQHLFSGYHRGGHGIVRGTPRRHEPGGYFGLLGGASSTAGIPSSFMMDRGDCYGLVFPGGVGSTPYRMGAAPSASPMGMYGGNGTSARSPLETVALQLASLEERRQEILSFLDMLDRTADEGDGERNNRRSGVGDTSRLVGHPRSHFIYHHTLREAPSRPRYRYRIEGSSDGPPHDEDERIMAVSASPPRSSRDHDSIVGRFSPREEKRKDQKKLVHSSTRARREDALGDEVDQPDYDPRVGRSPSPPPRQL